MADKALSLLGLARRAGKVAAGFDACACAASAWAEKLAGISEARAPST